METVRRLSGKTAIITGSASGMGRAGAVLFAREGANVVIADLNLQGAEETLQFVQDVGGTGIAIRFDATEEEDNQRVVDAAVENYGALDVAWANAGLPATFARVEDYSIELFDRLLEVNVKAPWLLARSAIAELRKTRGSFIVTASLSGLKGRAHHTGYQVSKGGATMLVKSLAQEFAPDGVRANSLCPVAAETPMLEQFLQGVDGEMMTVERLREGVPMGRLATAKDVAAAALFFASEESEFITGINLAIDGGITA
jgi:3-oxoacyl-[acyl-carrier protein] reductase